MNNKIPIPEELLVNLTLAKYQRGSLTHLNRSEHNVTCHNDHQEKQRESLRIISINTKILEKHKILHQIINKGILLWFIQPWRISKWPHKAACPTWLWWWLHRWWHINSLGQHHWLKKISPMTTTWILLRCMGLVCLLQVLNLPQLLSLRCLRLMVVGVMVMVMVFFCFWWAASAWTRWNAGVRSQIPWVAQVSFVFVGID